MTAIPAPALVLEPLRPDHAECMLAGLADPRAYAFLSSDPPDFDTLRRRYVRQAAGLSPDGAQLWRNWIIRRDGDPAGFTQATIDGATARIAYQIFPPLWRHGIGRRAVAATLDLVFAMPMVERAVALIDTRNIASQRLVLGLGFELARTIVNADTFKGSRSDEYEFVLVRHRWLETRTLPQASKARGSAPGPR